jgi:type II secretory pathway component PulM
MAGWSRTTARSRRGPASSAQIVLGLIRPGLTLAWGGLLLCAVLAYRLVIRPRLRQVAEAYA